MQDSSDTANIDAVVLAWWSAWASKDMDAIGNLALPDYLEFTGHSRSHRVGRNTLLRVAARAFSTFSIVEWNLAPRIYRLFGNSAVAAYTWESRVVRGGGKVIMRGAATDFLVCVNGSWRYVAHHSSAQEPEGV